MAVIKKRPTLVLAGEFSEMVGGEELAGELIVKADEPVPIDWIKVSLEGTEWGATGSGKQRRTKRINICHLASNLAGKGEIEVGTHRYPFRIALPANLPPTYKTGNAKTTYILRARASIPWWPDAKAKREILVAAPVPASPHPGEPLLLATRAEGPSGTDPYLEISFSHRVFAAGDEIRGAIALQNVEHHRYRRVVIKLVGYQTVRLGKSHGKSKQGGIEFAIDVSKAKNNERLPFTVRLDQPMAPTYSSQMWSQTWRLRVSIDVAWKRDPSIEIAVPVVEPRYTQLERARAAPAVGAERLEACWQEVADARDLEIIGAAMRGAVGGTSISIWREATARGPVLVGKVTYPSLGLGLEIEPAGGFFSGAGRRGVQIGVSGWDKAHEIEARNTEQCARFVGQLQTELVLLAGLAMTDEELTISRPGAGNRTVDLDPFVAPLVAIAKKIEASRTAIEPPASVARLLPAWRDLAAQMDGEINTANLSISGRFHGHPATVAAAWSVDGEPTEITAEIELVRAVDPAHELRLKPALLPELPEGMPSAARELIESLAGVASRLEIRADRISAACSWLADPRHVLGVLRTLAELAAVVSPSAPFR